MDASVADAAVVNLNGIKTLSANGVSTFFINGKKSVINGLKTTKRSSFLTNNLSSSSFN